MALNPKDFNLVSKFLEAQTQLTEEIALMREDMRISANANYDSQKHFQEKLLTAIHKLTKELAKEPKSEPSIVPVLREIADSVKKPTKEELDAVVAEVIARQTTAKKVATAKKTTVKKK